MSESLSPSLMETTPPLTELNWLREMTQKLEDQVLLSAFVKSQGDKKDERAHQLMKIIEMLVVNTDAKDLSEIEWSLSIRKNVKRLVKIFEFINLQQTQDKCQGSIQDDLPSLLTTMREIIDKKPDFKVDPGSNETDTDSTSGYDSDSHLKSKIPSQAVTVETSPSPAPQFKETDPMRNQVVLKEIIKNMTGVQILKCRLVSTQWNKVVTLILSKSCQNYVKLQFPLSYSDTIFKNHGDKRKITRIEQFQNFLKNSPTWSKFPCSTYHFSRGNLGSHAVQQFLGIYGKEIKNLKLSLETTNNSNFTTISIFRKLLLHDCPNLEYLELDTAPNQWLPISSDPSVQNCFQLFPESRGQIKLVKLKYFKNGTYGQSAATIVKDILEVAVNLEKFEGFTVDHTGESSTEANQNHENCGHMITSRQSFPVTAANFNPSAGTLIWLCKLANSQPRKLKNIRFCFEGIRTNSDLWAPVGTAITGILNSSAETLTQISQFHPMAFLEEFNLKIPKLSKLTAITFSDSSKYYEATSVISNHRMLPTNCNLFENFPALVRVTISMKTVLPPPANFMTPWEGFFEDNKNKMENVYHLRIEHSTYPAQFIQNLGQIFPQATILQIFMMQIVDFPPIVKAIWPSFPKATKVWIAVRKGQTAQAVSMDSAMTGIPEEICRQLVTSSRSMTLEQVERFRTLPSLLQLKELTRLKLEFWDSTLESWTTPIFTHVTGLYAFKLLNKKVKLDLWKHRQNNYSRAYVTAWDPIQPYIKFEDCDCC